MKCVEKVVEFLKNNNKTVATMESCTGGGVANAITCIEGASQVLKFSAVTYSNEFKIKMGVSSEVIEKYTVYSAETAREMSRNISKFADSDYGIGITGMLNCVDPANPVEDPDRVYISIYDKEKDVFYDKSLEVPVDKRERNKKRIITEVMKLLINNIK